MSSQVTLIQQSMQATFPEAEERVARYYQMMEYHLGWRNPELMPTQGNPGKLLRPQLCLLACRAAGGDAAQALPAAAALQLIHDFSLIHDDIEDNSSTRRGQPTVWSLWGLAQGINVGDGMFVLAHMALYRLSAAGVPAEHVLAVLRCFDQTILTICEGQYLDIDNEGKLSVTADDYLAMIGRKTAALIGCCAEIGALVAGADEATTSALCTFGRDLGLAFQVQDDLLGIWGEPELTGKPFAADLYRRKISLPVIYGLAQPQSRAIIERIYAAPEPSEADVAELLEALAATDAYAQTAQVAAQYHRSALAALDTVQGDVESVAALRSIAEGLLGRKT